jgi:hypothetical protein
MNALLHRQFQLSSEDEGVRCDAGGAFVGHVSLLKYAGGQWMPRETAVLSRALSAIYGLPVDASAKQGGIAAIAEALNEKDVTRAQLATLFLHFPEPPPLAKGAPSRGEVIKLAIALDWAGLLVKLETGSYTARVMDGEGGEFTMGDFCEGSALLENQISEG